MERRNKDEAGVKEGKKKKKQEEGEEEEEEEFDQYAAARTMEKSTMMKFVGTGLGQKGRTADDPQSWRMKAYWAIFFGTVAAGALYEAFFWEKPQSVIDEEERIRNMPARRAPVFGDANAKK